MFCHVFDRHPSFSLSVNAENRIPSGTCHPHLEYDADQLPETGRILYIKQGFKDDMFFFRFYWNMFILNV
jgi:hypothetical protein